MIIDACFLSLLRNMDRWTECPNHSEESGNNFIFFIWVCKCISFFSFMFLKYGRSKHMSLHMIVPFLLLIFSTFEVEMSSRSFRESFWDVPYGTLRWSFTYWMGNLIMIKSDWKASESLKVIWIIISSTLFEF